MSTFWPFPAALPPTPERDLRFKPVPILLGVTPRRGPAGPLVVPRLTCSGTKRAAAPFYIPKGVCVLFFKGWLGASLGGHQPWGRGPVTCRNLADDRVVAGRLCSRLELWCDRSGCVSLRERLNCSEPRGPQPNSRAAGRPKRAQGACIGPGPQRAGPRDSAQEAAGPQHTRHLILQLREVERLAGPHSSPAVTGSADPPLRTQRRTHRYPPPQKPKPRPRCGECSTPIKSKELNIPK